MNIFERFQSKKKSEPAGGQADTDKTTEHEDIKKSLEQIEVNLKTYKSALPVRKEALELTMRALEAEQTFTIKEGLRVRCEKEKGEILDLENQIRGLENTQRQLLEKLGS